MKNKVDWDNGHKLLDYNGICFRVIRMSEEI